MFHVLERIDCEYQYDRGDNKFLVHVRDRDGKCNFLSDSLKIKDFDTGEEKIVSCLNLSGVAGVYMPNIARGCGVGYFTKVTPSSLVVERNILDITTTEHKVVKNIDKIQGLVINGLKTSISYDWDSTRQSYGSRFYTSQIYRYNSSFYNLEDFLLAIGVSETDYNLITFLYQRRESDNYYIRTTIKFKNLKALILKLEMKNHGN